MNIKRGFNNYEKKACIYSYIENEDEYGLGVKREYVKEGEVEGFFDYITGENKYMVYKYKEDTTNIFIIRKKIKLTTDQYLKIDGDFYKVNLSVNPVGYCTTEVQLKKVKGVGLNE